MLKPTNTALHAVQASNYLLYPLDFSVSISATEVVRPLHLCQLWNNVSLSKPKEDSFADMIDRALEKEFPENEQNEGP